MIRVNGEDWGTAAEVAAELGPDITEAMVRRWASRHGLRSALMVGDNGRRERRYVVDQAAEIERQKRLATRGRPRRLDMAAALT